MKVYFIIALMAVFYISPVQSEHILKMGKEIVVENKFLKFRFSAEDGAVIAFTHKTDLFEFLIKDASFSPWKIQFEKNGANQILDITNAGTFKFDKVNPGTVRFEWGKFSVLENDSFKVSTTISLENESPFSKWKISVSGQNGEKLVGVLFPNIESLQDIGNEELAIPLWMGELIKNPRGNKENTLRSYALDYPGLMSMQFLALYNTQSRGLYMASNDTLGYVKRFVLKEDSAHLLNYHIVHFPSFDSLSKAYDLPYEGIIGVFKGDWIAAANIYKEWSTKQKWSEQSRFKNRKDSSWIEGTALWVWNRGKSDNVLLPARLLKERLGLPVSVFWHWWHNGPYDDAFPEYFPPREGLDSFKASLSAANKDDVRAIVYMNSYQWGTSTKSFEKENALQWAVRDVNGKTKEHVYNIFTRNSLTPMCVATEYWKSKYGSLAKRALEECNVQGIYMDQACLSFLCYNQQHNHTQGGGNYWVNHFADLTKKIRSGMYFGPDKILAGEGAGENWLPYLNAMLTLQASKERYSGVQDVETIPLFQAVYHPYAITFGSYSSLVTPPYDDLWPQEYRPKDPEQPLSAEFNEQFLMEQARSFVWGMQPMIANYHDILFSKRNQEMNYLFELVKVRYQVLKYLLYGAFIRPPVISTPEKIIPISRLSIYAGQGNQVKSFEKKVPLLYTSAWQSDDKRLGIALASINNNSTPIQFDWDISAYGLPARGKIFLITSGEKKLIKTYKKNKVSIDYILPPKGICFLEIVPE